MAVEGSEGPKEASHDEWVIGETLETVPRALPSPAVRSSGRKNVKPAKRSNGQAPRRNYAAAAALKARKAEELRPGKVTTRNTRRAGLQKGATMLGRYAPLA